MNSKKRLMHSVVACMLLCAPAVHAQQHVFVPPFDFPPTFSGNFGELRANHFHGGLDFKTGGAIGKPVRALADGYLSRIRVNHGSGYVLNVVFDNGYTAIYRHLSAFTGDVARRVEDLQYETESWEVDLEPRPDEYRVKAGQVIALSGNTGYSFGPHLHLDLIDTATDENVDPLPFFAHRVKDHVAPKATGLMLFPQPGRGVVNGLARSQTFAVHPDRVITAWGEIGAGIRAYDYMDGVHNRYGVHTVVLQVDGEEVFRSVVDRFAYSEHRYINSWTEGPYMKSFIAPGNRLRMLHAANGRRGLVTIDQERPYHFHYTLSDALGNTSHVRFTVQGRRSPLPQLPQREKYHFRWNRVNYLQEPGLDLLVPRGTLYDDVCLDYALQTDPHGIAHRYQLHPRPVYLHDYADLSIAPRRYPVADSTKYYLASVDRQGRLHSLGGRMQNGRLCARVRQLGTFTVAVDTVPPELTPVSPQQWGRQRRIVIRAKDTATGIHTYRGTIDGAYALFGIPNAVSGQLECRLSDRQLQKGQTHLLQLSVTDGCGNTTTEQFTFYY